MSTRVQMANRCSSGIGDAPRGHISVRHASPSEGYALWAPTYDDGLNPLLALEERYLFARLGDLTGKTVLDIACGTGRWLTKVIALGAQRAFGVDYSPEMLRRASDKPHLQHRLIRADGCSLPVRAATVDLVVCSFAIGHVSDLFGLAREMSRVCKPQACVYITDLHPSAREQGWSTSFRQGDMRVEIESFNCSFDEIRDAFESNGLE